MDLFLQINKKIIKTFKTQGKTASFPSSLFLSSLLNKINYSICSEKTNLISFT